MVESVHFFSTTGTPDVRSLRDLNLAVDTSLELADMRAFQQRYEDGVRVLEAPLAAAPSGAKRARDRAELQRVAEERRRREQRRAR